MPKRRDRALAAPAGARARTRAGQGGRRACSPESSPTSARSSASRTAATCTPASAAPMPPRGHRDRRLDRLRRRLPDRGRPRAGRRAAPGSTSTSRPRRSRAPTSAATAAPGRRGGGSTSSGRCGSATSSAATSSRATSTAWPRSSALHARGRERALQLPRARRAGPLRGAEGVGRAQRHLADGERGRRARASASTSSRTPWPSPPGARRGRAISSTSRSTRWRATSPGWPSTPGTPAPHDRRRRDALRRLAFPQRLRYLPPTQCAMEQTDADGHPDPARNSSTRSPRSRRSSTTRATAGCSSWSTTRTARTRATSSSRRRWHARRDQLHGDARPRPDLPRADRRAARRARPAADGAVATPRGTRPPSPSRSRRARA